MPLNNHMHALRTLAAILVAALAQAVTAVDVVEPPGPALYVPEDDLPWAVVAGRRVDFAANGAMTISERGDVICDVGLIYADPDWNEWGTQRRRSAPSDTWERDPEDPLVLIHRGTLHHFGGAPRFRFTQRTRVTETGLDLHYGVEPREGLSLGTFGLAVYTPVFRSAGGRLSLWPGFDSAELPAEPAESELLNGPARGAVLASSASAPVEFVLKDGTWWSAQDQRSWGLNTFRLVGADWWSRAALNQGETGVLSFELALAPVGTVVADMEGLRLHADRFGGVVLRTREGPVAELGFTWPEDYRKWLRYRGQPEEVRSETAGMYSVGGSAEVADAECTFELVARTEGEGVRLSGRIEPSGDLEPTKTVSWGALVPAARLSGPPLVDRMGHASRAVVPLADGRMMVMESPADWSLRSETEREREYVLIETDATRTDDGVQTASMRLYVRKGESE